MDTRHRIIAVDDTEDTLEVIRMTLEDTYDVLTVLNPMDLYEVIELFEPDLLIVDLMMPKISGFQLIEMLQRRAATKEIPIIILSAKDSPRDIKHGYRIGASLYLTKPFTPDRLLKNVQTQFECHPPAADRKKANAIKQVLDGLMRLPGFRARSIQLGTTSLPQNAAEKREEELKDRFRKALRKEP